MINYRTHLQIAFSSHALVTTVSEGGLITLRRLTWKDFFSGTGLTLNFEDPPGLVGLEAGRDRWLYLSFSTKTISLADEVLRISGDVASLRRKSTSHT